MTEPALLNNRYRLERQLGSGGMAVVYLAKDLMLERQVAVKILRQNASQDAAFSERFRQEAKAAAKLSHPNIVTIHDFGLDNERLFIVMEYVPGADLKTILQSKGRFTVEEAIPLLIQACAGIGYAHRAGLVHCDVKPNNLLVTPDQHLKVTDFGIARALGSIQPGEKSSVVWGSPPYLSPEQAAGEPPSPASDVYALGVVMYEMLTGRLPFTGQNAAELAQQHRLHTPLPPSRYNPSIPPELEEIIFKVLSKEPAARYRTADQLGRVLMTFTSAPVTSPVQTARLTSAPPTRRSTAAIPAPRLADSQPPDTVATPPPQIPSETTQSPRSLDIDWLTWGLVLLAILAVGGLIPLWLWVYLTYYPPGR